MEEAIISLIGSIALFTYAIFLAKGKGAFLLSGYNSLSDSEKAEYDERALCKFMSKMMLGLSFSTFLWALSDLIEHQILFIIGLILFISILVFGLVYMNTGSRFKK